MSSEKIIPVEGINLDISPLYLGNQKARLIKNMDISLLNKGDGSNVLVFKPLTSTELYSNIKLPAGKNIVCGGGVSRERNEAYIWRWNSLKNHSIVRIKDGVEEFVYVGPYLKLSLDPSHYISIVGKMFAQKVCVGDEERTYLYWTKGIGRQGFLCVEDSIETNSFNETSYPFFGGNYYDREELVSLGIVKPEGCIKIKPVISGNNGLNLIKERTLRFRISYTDRYGRPSEHGNLSGSYYTEDCLGSSVDCLDITFEAGGPLWEKINIEIQRGCTTEWDTIDVIDKYEKCNEPWYRRPINTNINYNTENNTITYRYCGGKSCTPIPDAETQRIENPLPQTSQSLFSIGGGIALANNEYGFKPWECDLKDKISFIVEKPTPDPLIDNTTRNIVVWMSIFNSFDNRGGTIQGLWNKDGKTVFGGVGNGNNEVESGIIGTYKMHFADPEQQGFIGYLAGTKIAAVSEQYRYNTEIGDYEKYGVAASPSEIRSNKWLQRFEFKNVPPGKFIFRVASHQKKLTEADYQKTSTYIQGHGTISGINVNHNIVSGSRELFIDVCSKDYNSRDESTVLVLTDITNPERRDTRVAEGYIYETKDGEQGAIPIEMASITATGIGINRRVYSTDHNGFYFCSAKDASYSLQFWIRKDCKFNQVGSLSVPRSAGITTRNFYAIDKWSTYLDEKCNRVIVKGRITDCDTGAGLPGIIVGITEGQFTLSNDQGGFELIVHDLESQPRKSKILFMSTGRCNITTCAGDKCFPTRDYIQPACSVCTERIFQLQTYELRLSTLGRSGLQKGGRYSFALSGSDWMGRTNAAQTDNRWDLQIPNENETKSFKYSKIKCVIDAAAVFPLWMKKLYFRFSKNLAYNDFLTWVVDRFEFIDNTGLVNTVTPTQIKIYYSSLNEYAKQNNFSSNVNWQFVDERNSLRIQDIVHFVANGDGVIFDKTITSLVKYDKDGRYFLIEYTSDLSNLKEGAYLKLMRPSECVDANIYFSVCKTIDIIDGKPTDYEFTLDAVDSYQVNRQIPTPVVITKKKTVIVENSNPVIYEEVEESETVNIIKPYSWSFEHDSPNDLWGTKCNNRGQAISKNPYEDIICKKSEVALSGAIGVNGVVNFHHYFDNARKTMFPDGYGGITAGVSQQNIILFICENDNYVINYDDNSVRYDSSGRAFVSGSDNQFSKPRPKSGENYGCLLIDRNTISYHNGLVVWFDSQRSCLVMHDFKSANDFSSGQCFKYLSFKSRDIKKFNKTTGLKRFWHGIINPVDGQYYLTDFNLRNKSYINNDMDVSLTKEDTFCFDLSVKGFPLRKTCSFTPELYLALESDEKESQLFSFNNGDTMSHYRSNNTVFNNFYGVQCQHGIRIIKVTDPLKPMMDLFVETYVDEVLLYGERVLTESGQLSKIPRNFFKRGENFWAAPILCDLNTMSDPNLSIQSKLFDGDRLRGRWIDILFMGDPDNLGKYFELTGIVISSMVVEKSVSK